MKITALLLLGFAALLPLLAVAQVVKQAGGQIGTALPATVACADGASVNIDVDTLYVDCTNNRVGVGTASPATLLDVNGAATLRGQTTVITASTTLNGMFNVGVSTLVVRDARVGAGTANPATLMHMSSGTLTIDGNTQLVANMGGTVRLWSRTQVQIDTLTPGAAGELIFCSNCSSASMCVSTGTAAAQWKRSDSTTIGCGSGN